MVDKAAKKRTQKAIDDSRAAAKKARKIAAQSSGAKRVAYLKDAADYENSAAHYVRTCKDLGVK